MSNNKLDRDCCVVENREGEKAGFAINTEQVLKTLTPISGLLLLLGFSWGFTPDMEGWQTFYYVLSLCAGSVFVLRSAVQGLIKQRFLNISFLVVIASLGALYIGEYGEAAAVVFLFSLAEFFEEYGIERSRKAVEALLKRSPKIAYLLNGDTVAVEDVVVGTVIAIRPGELIPLDGVVLKGDSAVDESAITGESIPTQKQEKSLVLAGTMNLQGYLEIEVQKISADSTFSKIVALVEKAQASRAPTQAFIDTFARYYTPSIVFASAVMVVVPVLLFGQDFDIWFYRALVLLVIACPCALVIATPVAIASSIGGASRNGILIKGGIYLEKLAKIKAIAFDKTRTLTYGRHVVTDVLVLGSHTKEEIIADAAGIEHFSSHPLAESILDYAKQHGIQSHAMKEYQNLAGKGGKAKCLVCNADNYIGNKKLMQEYGITDDSFNSEIEHLEKEGKTVVLIAEGKTIIGAIGISDVIREEAKSVIERLKHDGIESIMLTGDNEHSAAYVASQTGIKNYFASLLPEEKLEHIKKLQTRYDTVGMVGDGINDAPSLVTAQVGFAIASGGTDIAIESSDVTLLSGNLNEVVSAIHRARKTMRIVRCNVALALGIKVVFLALAPFGLTNLVFAIAADSGMSIIVILNSLRLFKKID